MPVSPSPRKRTLFPLIEQAVKKPIWGCRMCGQCVLHSTGMTCPMICPKTLRNGPCGGVREDGTCEVVPAMRCVWVKGEDRVRHRLMPRYWEEEFNDLRPPVDNRLQGTSSWANLLTGRDRQTPAGWQGRTRPGVADRPGVSLVELDHAGDPASCPAVWSSGRHYS